MSAPESPGLDPHSVTGDLQCRPLQVLIAEDDEADAYLIRQALQASPMIGGIAVARDGEEALALMRSGGLRPDLAIIDLNMPRKGGMGLLVDFACGGWDRFPVAVLTSSKSSIDQFRARLRGAHTIITKPDTQEELAEVLEGLVASAVAISQDRHAEGLPRPSTPGA